MQVMQWCGVMQWCRPCQTVMWTPSAAPRQPARPAPRRFGQVLHCLVIHERRDMYKLLVQKHGANPWLENARGDTPLMMAASEKVRNGLLTQVVGPKRFGQDEEFAGLCKTIIENGYLNGETIRIDGGIRFANL